VIWAQRLNGFLSGYLCAIGGAMRKKGTDMKNRVGHLFGALVILGLVVGPLEALDIGQAAAESAISVRAQNSKHAGELLVPVNKSQILRVDQPYVDLLVGNSEIADVLPLTNRSVYVLGKKIGSTNLSVYGDQKRLLAVVDLVVGYDVECLKGKLFEMMPEEQIEVRAINDTVILSGTIGSQAQLDKALSVANSFAPGHVKNVLDVRGSHQVMVEVRFAEMSRTTAKDLGFNLDALVNVGAAAFGLASGLPTSLSGVFPDGTIRVRNNATNSLFGNFTNNDLSVSGVLDALEEKGVVKVLAEPNLIALSGDTAKFLAGGEFPIPVAQDDDTVTIEFKEFGVSLAFTPTVLSDGLINLIVTPEVSQIDVTTSITTLSGATIPGLTTRRATTTVELRDGQSFAIAGLIQSNFADQVRQIPGFGDIPVLGALSRSTEFQREETELVIIVTPRLVQPVKAGRLALPTDNFVPPSDVELFLLGHPEASESGKVQAGAGQAGRALGAQNAGGVDGPFGHIIP